MKIVVLPYPGAWGIVRGLQGGDAYGVRAWRECDGAEGVFQMSSRTFVKGNATVNPARDVAATEVLTKLYTQRDVTWDRHEVYMTALQIALILLSESATPDVDAIVENVVHQPGMEQGTRPWADAIRIGYRFER